MTERVVENAIHLQLLVGFLGEKGQHAWWSSRFLSADADAFLGPVFPRSLPLARYQGVLEAAKTVHDERIGVGRVFHAFRLPSELQQNLFDQVQRSGWPEKTVAALESGESAISALKDLADTASPSREGPIQVGDLEDLKGPGWISRAADSYHSAFQNEFQTFPYWSGAA